MHVCGPRHQHMQIPRAVVQHLGFHMPPPAALSYGDVAFCPGAPEPPAADLRPLPLGLRTLFVMSASNSIASWLVAALRAHPGFLTPGPSGSAACASHQSPARHLRALQ